MVGDEWVAGGVDVDERKEQKTKERSRQEEKEGRKKLMGMKERNQDKSE